VLLLAIDFSFCKIKRKKKKKKKRKKEKEKRKRKRKKRKRKEKKRGHKRIERKAPCNNSNLAIPFKHGQVLFKFNVARLVNKSDQTV
jgi:hypothetical protein